jgi:hypothetical protein
MGGGVQEALAAQMERDGVELPENVSEQPVLQGNLIGYLEAFYELDTERDHGMALGPIPWSSIVAYAERYGFDVEEMVYFVRHMDGAHLERVRKSISGGPSGTEQTVQRPPRPD